MPDIYAEKLTLTAAEGRRLNEQSDLLTGNIGYLIHPHVAAALSPSPRIADIGIGTGRFLRCVQESGALPNATLDVTRLYPSGLPK